MRFVELWAGALLAGALAVTSPQPAHAAGTYMVPPTVDPTGVRDVTAELMGFVAGVPDGSTITFPPGARYRIEGTFLTEGRHDLVFEGNGAEFFATTDGDRSRAHIRFNHSVGITIRDIVVTGANPEAGTDGQYIYEREAQHGLAFEGSSDVLVERARITDVWGDLVYIDKHRGVISQRITVRDSFLEGSGRMGVGITGAEDVTIERNWISDIRRSTIDLEPYNENVGVRRIRIADNDIGPGLFYFVAAGGTAAPMEDISIIGNRMHGMIPSITVRGFAEQPRQRITVADNVSDSMSNRSVFTFYWVDGVTVTGNVMHLDNKEEIAAVETVESCFVTVSGNDFGAASPLAVMSAERCPDSGASPGPIGGSPTEATPDPTAESPPPDSAPIDAAVAAPADTVPPTTSTPTDLGQAVASAAPSESVAAGPSGGRASSRTATSTVLSGGSTHPARIIAMLLALAALMVVASRRLRRGGTRATRVRALRGRAAAP